ncbi:SDR family NAD(P)-dependent oxidoreductase [Bacillus toyonensis]|uniref:SDR family NAD(P)-dependent oxidoreductase n=1 Tax=Bacillus toyonensis TaxID=155322 RepID=UPI0027BAD6BA|nr:SDR family NAD(P)-dependent oxidoreductase [Bacillus toyonensis]
MITIVSLISINTASVFGFLVSTSTYAYHASEGAVIMMTKSATLELTDYGLRIFAITPEVVDTHIR